MKHFFKLTTLAAAFASGLDLQLNNAVSYVPLVCFTALAMVAMLTERK